ncbi:hypothetical protein WN944_015496 [Citrus x changshan-huyou]|uniref:CCHC-type domain-containing protein n=1 Tax=Citrus x changshan-huyou TaxID=2935761 RepID=A0AAP0QMM5_9ROSI
MRKLMIEHFLPSDYEQTLFSRYQHCRHANRIVHEYVTEFHKLVARVDVRKTENQKISRFIDGLCTNIQDEVFKQSHHTLSSVIQLALKIEAQLNKRGTRIQVSLQSSTPPQKPDWNKQKTITRPREEMPRPNFSQNQPARRLKNEPVNKSKSTNPYAVLRGNKCYRCGQTGHYSNQCRQSKLVNLVTHDDDIEEEEYPKDDEYEKEDALKEFTYEDEGVSLVIRRLMYTPKKDESIQQHNIFKTRCTVNQRVCDLIIDSESSENIVSKTMVDKL